MECMLQPLRNPSKARTKELAVSAIGAIGEYRSKEVKVWCGLTEKVASDRPDSLPALILLCPVATAAQDSLLPYFPTVMELLREFLLTCHEDLQLVQIQSLGEEGP